MRRSWQRAIDRGLDPDYHLPPVPLEEAAVEAEKRDHPLGQVWPAMVDSFRGLVSEPGQLLFASDADGHLLWTEGEPETVRGAERVHLVPGALWSEEGAATSAVGTTLVLGHPFQVFGPEHYLSIATPFACSAAPIRDPVGGGILGTLDLTTTVDSSRSLALHMVSVASQLAEAQLHSLAEGERARLRSRYAERLTLRTGVRSALVTEEGRVLRCDPEGWLPARIPGPLAEGPLILPGGAPGSAERLTPGGPFFVLDPHGATRPEETAYGGAVAFSALGLDRATLVLDGVTHELGPRHSEIVALLLASPGGLSAEALARELYGEGGKAVSVRAEMSRLRRILGYRLVSDPYRLREEVRADFRELARHVAALAPEEILDAYPGPLLPSSNAPGVIAVRETLHARVRLRLLTIPVPDAVSCWFARRDTSGGGE